MHQCVFVRKQRVKEKNWCTEANNRVNALQGAFFVVMLLNPEMTGVMPD